MIKGFDYLGGVKFQKEMLGAHKIGWCGGIFLHTFGDARGTLEAMCRSGKFSEIVVHLAPFDNSHQYPISTLLPQILKDGQFCEGLQDRFPNTKLLLSPFCENKHSSNELTPVFNKLKETAPSCLMVNTIIAGGVSLPNVITEIHLENANPRAKPPGEYIVSADGFGGKGTGNWCDTECQVIYDRYPDARQIRGWGFECNGKYGWKDTTDLAHRRNFPSQEYLTGNLEAMEQRESGQPYGHHGLYKAFADDHDCADGKDNKALVLSPKHQAFINVFDSKGGKVDSFKRVLDDYSDHNSPFYGFGRYYSSRYAYQVAAIAHKNTGSNLIKPEGLFLTDGRMRSQ